MALKRSGRKAKMKWSKKLRFLENAIMYNNLRPSLCSKMLFENLGILVFQIRF